MRHFSRLLLLVSLALGLALVTGPVPSANAAPAQARGGSAVHKAEVRVAKAARAHRQATQRRAAAAQALRAAVRRAADASSAHQSAARAHQDAVDHRGRTAERAAQAHIALDETLRRLDNLRREQADYEYQARDITRAMDAERARWNGCVNDGAPRFRCRRGNGDWVPNNELDRLYLARAAAEDSAARVSRDVASTRALADQRSYEAAVWDQQVRDADAAVAGSSAALNDAARALERAVAARRATEGRMATAKRAVVRTKAALVKARKHLRTVRARTR